MGRRQKPRYKGYGHYDPLRSIDIVLISLPCVLVMVFALSQGFILLLVPIAYFLGAYLARANIGFSLMVFASVLCLIIGLTLDYFTFPTDAYQITGIFEVGAFILGYSVYRSISG